MHSILRSAAIGVLDRFLDRRRCASATSCGLFKAAIPDIMQAWVHRIAAFLAFGLFAGAELIVLCRNVRICDKERWWRSLGCASMLSSILMFFLNSILFFLKRTVLPSTWTFWFELSIGSAFLWQCQLIWNFSSNHILAERDRDWRFCSWPWQYILLVGVIVIDGAVRLHTSDWRSHVRQVVLVSSGEFVLFLFLAWMFFHPIHQHVCKEVESARDLICCLRKSYGTARCLADS